MHSAIVAVTMPSSEQEWSAFLATIEPARKNPAVQVLAEHVWLIDVQKSPTVFARFVDACERHKFSYRVLSIENAPQWLPVGFDPETIPARG